MREKVKTLERRIANLTIAAVENQAIVQKLMALTQVLLPITDETQLTHTLLEHLKTQFAIPMVGLQLWGASIEEQVQDKESIECMKDLYCGFAEHAPSLSVFQSEPQQPRSVVIIPLRFAGQTNTSGVLGFGSTDKDRFAPTLEVDFLRTLSEIVCAALSRLQKINN